MRKVSGQTVKAYSSTGGVCVVESNSESKESNVVVELKSGNTQITICDDCCRNTTPVEVDAILARIARRAQAQLSAEQQ